MVLLNSEKRLYLAGHLYSRWKQSLFKRKPFNPQRILIIRIDEIGDMITSIPVFDTIAQYYPSATVDVWCKTFVKPIIEHHPIVSQIFNNAPSHNTKYDWVIQLRGNWASLKWVAKHKPKWFSDRGSVRFLNKLAQNNFQHEVVNNLQVIKPFITNVNPPDQLKIHITKRNIDQARLFLQRNVIQNFAILHIGARKKLRRWSLSNFALLAAYLNEKYKLDIVFVGGDEDQTSIQKVQKTIHFQTFSFVGEGSLTDYAALCSLATIMIGNDSGPMHIAVASGVPTLALFGPQEPALFKPWGKNGYVIHHKLHCNPCDQEHCIYPNHPCISLISCDEVIHKIENEILIVK